ncbi:alpha/beta hydrolase [Compostimonas suwonensis]|uniref:Phospholipase/carboxylesterase n=1 Tax=Compostimonas suwonensis TaxID=1048394 RepID=A0A2M9C571_9MICO|nr:alpha/beta hydrolase-fold protein [Compostimonas suwonensis]PJJ65668.1 phospholipase/carboxylesterase [Compostimonas suwonensis]
MSGTAGLRIDDEAVLWSASERDRRGRPLLVLLHGYASHEGDLFGLAPYLPLAPVIASVRAPIRENGGYAWFSRLDNTPGDPEARNVDAAAAAVLAWLGRVAPAASVGLLGFSQGGVMALQLLRLAPERFDYAVQLSGFVADGAHDGDALLADRGVPVFWGRGTEDAVIPRASVERTDAWLPGHSTLRQGIYEGVGHSISGEELSEIRAFIGEQLAP